MSRKKPKTNRAGDKTKSLVMDRCETPPPAVVPLLPYLNPAWHLWESACGQGYLQRTLEGHGFTVTGTDLLYGENYFSQQPAVWDAQITNPPFSAKYDWLRRACHLGKPFAILIPSESMFALSFIEIHEQYPIEILCPRGRINFKMPSHTRFGEGSAQMHTSWFTRGLNVGRFVTYVDVPGVDLESEDQPALFDARAFLDLQPRLLELDAA